MAKRRIPPPDSNPRPLMGPNVLEYIVGSWCPTDDGSGPAEAVALTFVVQWNRHTKLDLVFRLRSPQAVDNMIQMLLRHKRDVWPEAP